MRNDIVDSKAAIAFFMSYQNVDVDGWSCECRKTDEGFRDYIIKGPTHEIQLVMRDKLKDHMFDPDDVVVPQNSAIGSALVRKKKSRTLPEIPFGYRKLDADLQNRIDDYYDMCYTNPKNSKYVLYEVLESMERLPVCGFLDLRPGDRFKVLPVLRSQKITKKQKEIETALERDVVRKIREKEHWLV